MNYSKTRNLAKQPVKDLAKLKALHQEIATAREAGLLDAAFAQRIHTKAILAVENDPHFLESFFHVLPTESLKRKIVQQRIRKLEGDTEKGKVEIIFFLNRNFGLWQNSRYSRAIFDICIGKEFQNLCRWVRR